MYLIIFSLIGCPVAMAYEHPEPPSPCVITTCDDLMCEVETPEGTVKIEKKPRYEEGTRVTCPLWMIDPT